MGKQIQYDLSKKGNKSSYDLSIEYWVVMVAVVVRRRKMRWREQEEGRVLRL